MHATSFESLILRGHKDAAVEVPFDPGAKWDLPPVRLRPGRNGHPVTAVLNGVEFEGGIVPRMRRFWLEIPADILARAQAAPGELVAVTVRPRLQDSAARQ